MNIKFFLLNLIVLWTSCFAMDSIEKTQAPFISSAFIFPKLTEKLPKKEKQNFYKQALSDVFPECTVTKNTNVAVYHDHREHCIPILIGKPTLAPINAEVYKKDNKADKVMQQITDTKAIDIINNAISQIVAVISNNGTSISVNILIRNFEEQSLNLDIKNKKATCLTIHAQTGQLFVGCNDGTLLIYKFKPQSDTTIAVEVITRCLCTENSINAIKFFDTSNNCIVHSTDGSWIWHINLPHPRVLFPGQADNSVATNQYRSEYATGKKLSTNTNSLLVIRSHANRGWIYDADLNYIIPCKYSDENSTLSNRQKSLLYLLSKFSQRTKKDIKLEENIKSLYSGNALVKSFEPEVHAACVTLLEEIAQYLKITLDNNLQ